MDVEWGIFSEVKVRKGTKWRAGSEMERYNTLYQLWGNNLNHAERIIAKREGQWVVG